MPRSFGSGTGIVPSEDVGIIIPVPPPVTEGMDAAGGVSPAANEALREIADDIRLIRQRYAAPAVLDAQTFNLAVLEARRFDFRPAEINSFLLTAEFGVLFLYFGDYTGQSLKLTTAPHIVISSQVVPQTQQFMIPPSSNYIITVQATTFGPAGGSLVPMYL